MPVAKKSASAKKMPAAPLAPARTVLLAVSGSSPAIITETVWALAQENPPVIPDRIVVVTTTSGARALETQLLAARADWRGLSVWQSLRQALLGRDHARDPRLMLEKPLIVTDSDAKTGTARELEDIRTPADNAAAAETILSAVRRFSTDADHRLIGLLSGGRKTMGALLHAALSLAGRPGDRLLHVLVAEPFDNPRLTPAFFFPGQPGENEHRLPDTGSAQIPGHKAKIDLADVPLVALGELIFNRTGQAPATFASFARVAAETVAKVKLDTCSIDLVYEPATRTLSVNQFRVSVPEGRPDGFLQQLIRDRTDEHPLADRAKLCERWKDKKVCYKKPDDSWSLFIENDLSNAQNVLRELLVEEAAVPPALIDRIFPLRAPLGLSRPGINARLQE